MQRNKDRQASKWQRIINMSGCKTRVKLWHCLILFFLFTVPVNAMAAKERYVLDFGDRYMVGIGGDSATLYLKKALRKQYPGIDVTDFRLLRVVVLAKTKKGRGGAQLRVGPEVSDFYRVDGSPRRFFHDHKETYDRISIENPYSKSKGPWQLNFVGKVKLRKVVLIVEERKRHHYGVWTPRKKDLFFRVW